MPDQIFPTKTYNDINKALGEIATVRTVLERASKAQIPCEDLHTILDDREQYLTAIKAEFFTDKP